ncbi:MAG: hypothetical protein HDS38_08240 [Bacteroides sp.]|nr:hypothetical protein [Bacteroides sp.]
MKRRVALSTFSIILTIAVIALFVVGMISYLNRGVDWLAYLLAGSLVLICCLAMYFTPMSISVEDGCLNINMLLRTKSIPLRDIQSVALCPPTMSEKRLLGSGGFFGYWGWFREPSIGRYFAYYGKASDCFLVRLKDGRLYMFGCVDALGIMECINSNLTAR